MSEFKVLIIEDDFDAYRSIKKLLPENCKTAYEGEPDEKNDGLSTNERSMIMSFQDTCPGSFVKSSDSIVRFIKDNQSELRLIICDDSFNGCPRAGEIIIENLRSSEDWFNNNIPILVCTAYSVSLVGPLEHGYTVVSKEELKNSTEISNAFRRRMKNDVSRFNEKYKHHLNENKYKVALSFTGSEHNNPYEERHREFVRDLAHLLMQEYGREKVFYDEDAGVTGWGKDDFKRVYENGCEFVVVFLSEKYGEPDSPWTQKEWEGIKTHFNPEGVCRTKRVLFVQIGEQNEEDGVSNKLSSLEVCPEQIWINGVNNRKEYYKILDGESNVFRKSLGDAAKGEIHLPEIAGQIIKEYNANAELRGLVKQIIDHIERNSPVSVEL